MKIVGYETETGVYCPGCATKLNLKMDKPILAGSMFDVIPACDECGDDIEDVEEIEEEEE